MIARRLKRGLYGTLRAVGVNRFVGRTDWRRRRLLILCYHGVAIDDEHLWRPGLFATPELLRERLALVRDGGFRVLPLAEGVERLREGTLPPRSVCITFDDGLYDFRARALPVLEEFGFPVTVYLSTYYCRKRAPVFPLMCSYLLWRGRGTRKRISGMGDESVELDLAGASQREETLQRILEMVSASGARDDEKQRFLRRLAEALELDFERILETGKLRLMSPDEVREVSGRGVDVQLHTHRHRSPVNEELYRGEVRENRRIIRDLTGRDPVHFCFPSGVYRPEFVRWLHAEGVVSATTCDPGIASSRVPRLLLPRLVDHVGLSASQFDAWLSGVGAVLARRSRRSAEAFDVAADLEAEDAAGGGAPRPDDPPPSAAPSADGEASTLERTAKTGTSLASSRR